MEKAMREAVAKLADDLNELHTKATEAGFDLTPAHILAALEAIKARS